MRPDLSDLIAGVQRLLQTDVVPALPDAYLQEQVSFSLMLLEYCKSAWPHEHLAVAEEHADLVASIGAASATLDGLPAEQASALASVLGPAARDDGPRPATASLDSVLAADRERRAALERTLELLDRLEVEAPASTVARHAVRAPIDAYLARSAARRSAALERLGIRW